jgi:hypothetical protein
MKMYSKLVMVKTQREPSSSYKAETNLNIHNTVLPLMVVECGLLVFVKGFIAWIHTIRAMLSNSNITSHVRQAQIHKSDDYTKHTLHTYRTYKFEAKRPAEKRPLGKPKGYNQKMDVKVAVYEGVI